MLHPGKFSPAWGHGVYNTYIVQSKNHQWNYNAAAAAAAARLNYDILCLLLIYWNICHGVALPPALWQDDFNDFSDEERDEIPEGGCVACTTFLRPDGVWIFTLHGLPDLVAWEWAMVGGTDTGWALDGHKRDQNETLFQPRFPGSSCNV